DSRARAHWMRIATSIRAWLRSTAGADASGARKPRPRFTQTGPGNERCRAADHGSDPNLSPPRTARPGFVQRARAGWAPAQSLRVRQLLDGRYGRRSEWIRASVPGRSLSLPA